MVENSIVDRYLNSQPNKIREKGVIYVTDCVKLCLRQAYYDVVSPKRFDAGTLRIFEAGRVLESYWVDVLSKTPGYMLLGTQLPARWPLKNGGSIHGRIDALFQINNGPLTVREVKSIKSFAFMNGAAKPEHISQCNFYICVLGLNFGFIDYISKENFLQGLGEVDQHYKVEADYVAFADMVKRGEDLAGYVERSEAPPAMSNWSCNGWCNHVECEFCKVKGGCS